MKKKRILCVGRIYCDLVFRSDALPEWGHETYSQSFDCTAGGGAFITAAYLTALGHQVKLSGSAGAAEPFGSVIARDLDRCGIDSDLLTSGSEPQVTVAIAGQKDRAFLTQRCKEEINLPDVTGFDHLHIGEISTLIACPDLIDLARRNNATLSSDCGGESDYPKKFSYLLNELDIFFPNQDETDALNAAGFDLDDVKELVVKNSIHGAKVRSQGDWYSTDAQPVNAIDPTGAGDAFNAGYLHGWLAGLSKTECLKIGARCGAAAVTKMGGWKGREDVINLAGHAFTD